MHLYLLVQEGPERQGLDGGKLHFWLGLDEVLGVLLPHIVSPEALHGLGLLKEHISSVVLDWFASELFVDLLESL